MSNIINLQIDEGSTFTKVLTFTKEVKKGEFIHPITGERKITTEREPIDLTGYNVVAQIRTEPKPTAALIASFNADIVSADKGMVTISLGKEQTLSLNSYLGTSGHASKRVFTLGYYDIILISPQGKVTRAFEGKCYLNRTSTNNPYATSSKNTSMNASVIIKDVDSTIELDVDPTKPHYSAGLRYFSGGIPKTPSAGSIEIYRMPETTKVYNKEPVAIVSATNPAAEISWKGNTSNVKAVPSGLSGVDSYQLVVVSNNS